MRRHVLSAAAPACLLLGLTPATAGAAVAPPGEASAAAARVSNLVGVSSTGASASDSQGDAEAAVVTLQGKPVLDNTGGSQSGKGQTGGALVDTGSAQAPRIKVAPWEASAEGTKGSGKRESRASAAAAEVEVPDTVKVGVLTSDSRAVHEDQRSTGTSSSNAADVALSDKTRLVLLHSEVDSNANGHSYLVGLAGNEIGTEESVGELCALDAAGVAAVSCLTASGGVANGITTGTAEVLGVQTTVGLNPASAFATSASTAAGSITPPPTILESVAEASLPAAETPRAAPLVTPAAELPRTGVAAGSLAASGLTGLLSGLALRRFGRRRRTA